MDNNFSAYMIADQKLKAGAAELALGIRLPWYRALPLSTVEVGALSIDGRPIGPDRIQLEINDKRIAANELGSMTQEWWYVLDTATLHVADLALTAAAEHQVNLTLNLYPPYMPGFTWVTQSSKRLKVQ